MATYGIYQVLDPLYVTPTGSVCSAKIVGGDDAGRLVAKVFNPPKPDPDEPNWEPKFFLDRAQVQRRVAAAGGAHWAPIYASGFTPEGGAYYITDYHALTARKMIEGRVALDGTALHAIVSSVVAGLGEVRRIADRAHANLKPSNVLLVGKGPLDELRAVLTDPGQEYKAEKDGEAGDLHALGLLIHELVLHRPPAGATDVPVAGAAEWARLGNKAEGWRQLCADLLSHPIAPRAGTLAAVAKLVEQLSPPRVKVPQFFLPGGGKRPARGAAPAAQPHAAATVARPRKPGRPWRVRRRAVQLLAVVLLVGGGLGVVAAMEASAREELCTARSNWFGPLAAGLEEPHRRQRFQSDAHLRRIADGVGQVERAGVECRGGGIRPLGFMDYTKTRDALATLRQVERDLAPEIWPRLQNLRELARTFEQRGWQQPAGYVAQLVEGVRPTPAASTALTRPSVPPAAAAPAGSVAAKGRDGKSGRDSAGAPAAAASGFVERIDRVLRLQPIIEEQAPAAEAKWKQLDALAGELERSDDTFVRGFGAMLRREGAAAVRLGDEGFEGTDSLAEHAELAGQVLAALRDAPAARVDQVRFAAEVLREMNPADPEPADVQVWLLNRPKYAVRTKEILEQADKLQQRFTEMATKVSNSAPEDPAEVEAFSQEQKHVEGALREFREARFIEKDITSGAFTKRVDEIDAQIRNLDQYYHAEDPNDWLKNLATAGILTKSEQVKGKWAAWVRNLQTDVGLMAENRELFAENKQRTVAFREALQKIDLLPHPPDGLNEASALAAGQYRENRLGDLLDKLKSTDPRVERDELDATRNAMDAWYEELRALAADFPIGDKLLTLDDRPDEAWQKRNPTFWADPLVRPLVQGDVARINRLQKLRKADRAELVREAKAEAVRPEVRVAAWQLLGRAKPAWPATVAELETEAALRKQVAAAIKPLGEFDRAPLTDELRKEGPRRWRRLVEAVTADEAAIPDPAKNPLGIALNRAADFEVSSTAIQEISPPARFNVWLYFANEAIRAGDYKDDEIDEILKDLRLAAEGLEDEQRATAVIAKLDKLNEPEPFEGQQLGPTFAMAVPGLTEPIQFRRVEPKGARPFYLGTREVTLEQFARALEGRRVWTEALRLQWPHEPPKPNDRRASRDDRRGPRVWEWQGDAAAPRLGPAEYWLTPTDRNDFPSAFHPEPDLQFNRNVISDPFGGMPSDRHPMQYVSAGAALYYAAALGCRLPTSAEWRAALAASGKTPASQGWNLRDQSSWETFRVYAAKNKIPADLWPDRDAFPESADARRAAAPAPVSARAGNDSTLLFRPAPAASDDAFHDLVGNVAEYVCDQPEAFARWDMGSAEAVTGFLKETADAVAVIGASALSPEDLAAETPRPVTQPHRGYSDVGLRLAFTAPSRNKAERLKWVLAGEQYLEPARTVSADTGAR